MVPLDWMDALAAQAGAPARAGEDARPDAAVERRLLADLNEPQREAVCAGEGPLLILAGAGSGKTRVITRRIAWLVAAGRAAAHEVLAITFTNKAAREMRERVLALDVPEGSWISTFHAMCARILRRDVEALGGWTRDFSIYDTHDRNQLLKRLVKELGYDPQHYRPGMLGAAISDWKNRAWNPEEGDGAGEDEVFRQVRERYAAAMRASDALDFDDLLLLVLRLFDEHPAVRDRYAARFRYVLVDEYQDTNRVQYLLTRHLAAGHGNLAVCGDPDQSIYGWRGADLRNILDFERDFGRGGARVQVTKLEENYRSTPTILKAAQAVIRRNLGRKEKDLWSAREAGERIRVLACDDEHGEANEIAAQVHGALARGYRPDQVAVFYRVNFMQRALERGLRLAGVPYQVVGGVEFYQRREVRDLIAYLQLVANPRDDVACARVLNVPARGVGERSLEQLAALARERGLSLLDAARSSELGSRVRGRARAGIAAFAGLLGHLESLRDGPAERALEQIVDETEYYAWLEGSGEPEAAGRVENVEELLAHARGYDKESSEGGVRGFLQEVALVSDVDGYDAEGPRVTLMTLHSSKGLEFPVVFVAGAEEELLPHAMALREAPDPDAAVEEERRLFYVGMTRAQDLLHVSWARTRMYFGETSWRVASRFLEELPAELCEGLRAASDEEEDEALGAWEQPEASAALRVGDRVEHDHFGFGRVERLQGAGINARVTVDFHAVGSKVLLVQYAKLKVHPS